MKTKFSIIFLGILLLSAAFLSCTNEREWVNQESQIVTLAHYSPAIIDPVTHKIYTDAAGRENNNVYWIEYYGESMFGNGFYINTYIDRSTMYQTFHKPETKIIERTLGNYIYCFRVLEVSADSIKLELYGVYINK